MPDHWSGLDAAFAELEAECTEIVRGLTVKLWQGILQQTPQFAGRAVASWTYSLNTPQFVDRSDYIDVDLHVERGHYNLHGEFNGLRKGNKAAISLANAENLYRDANFKLGDTVYISNGVNHGEGSYAADLENGSIILRAVNRPGAMVSRSLDSIGAMYTNDISRYQGQVLKSYRIGR